MSVERTEVYTCDNCGAVSEDAVDEFGEPEGWYKYTDHLGYGSTAHIDGDMEFGSPGRVKAAEYQLHYCLDCVQAIRVARDAALGLRRIA